MHLVNKMTLDAPKINQGRGKLGTTDYKDLVCPVDICDWIGMAENCMSGNCGTPVSMAYMHECKKAGRHAHQCATRRTRVTEQIITMRSVGRRRGTKGTQSSNEEEGRERGREDLGA